MNLNFYSRARAELRRIGFKSQEPVSVGHAEFDHTNLGMLQL